MRGFLWILLLALSGLISPAQSGTFTLELEQYALSELRMPRSAASGNFTVLLKQGQKVQMEICVHEVTHMSIRNVVYSNDGNVDSVGVSIDGQHAGSFVTTYLSENGNAWNKFKSTGPLSAKVKLDIGRHTITFEAMLTDPWGVEIDNVILLFDDDRLQYSDLVCNLYCFDIKYDDVPRMDSIPSGRFVQKSVSTQCSEQDNIKIEVYHETAQDFDITATLPKYQSFANNREPDYSQCVLPSPYWVFKDKVISPSTAETTYVNSSLKFSGTHSSVDVNVDFSFKKITPSREVDERLMSTNLFIKLRNLPRENVKIKPEYMQGGRWLALVELMFTPFSAEQTWLIPAHTWSPTSVNKIRLVVQPGQQQVVFDTIRLDARRPRDETIELYASANVVYQGVRLGFWQHWKEHPASMTVSVQNGSQPVEYSRVDSIRVYAKVPWTGGYAQVLVLFQDGRTRIQTVTPHGLDNIPFGASVNIGQPQNTSEHRPYSPISHVSIDPKSNRLVLRYYNGNQATLEFETSFIGTRLKVRDINFKSSRVTHPIMTFRSMWVSDGHSDTDHVTFNGDISRHISSNWTELYGISAVFFRKCISMHNTQGPDITITFLSKADL
ncbi:uncharacterized protein LOC128243453 [Mya arenaria]|uniref:uncharacterized protein LOC128243453 n=1 Tax=Mya arenaria TaxID=6604 RepID=UPI0022E0424D|nr:uncharacterized protein LOC128243453 [Mya arenaria]